jgi:alpha-beta hydrolase superfamily lysophospholipase
LAYKPSLEIESELRKLGYNGTDVLFVKTPLASCFILRWGDVTAVALRGSVTWREWLNNANARLQYTEYGGIHAGFLHTIEQIGPVLVPILLCDTQRGARIFVTGHSRGGALATLLVVFLGLNGQRVHGLVTFGSPMVGDGRFVSLFSGGDVKPPRGLALMAQRSYLLGWAVFVASWPLYGRLLGCLLVSAAYRASRAIFRKRS